LNILSKTPTIQYNRYNCYEMDAEEDQKNRQNMMQSAGRGYVLGLTAFAISSQIFLFPLAGLWIDRRTGTGLLFAAIGFVLGMVAAISQLMRLK